MLNLDEIVLPISILGAPRVAGELEVTQTLSHSAASVQNGRSKRVVPEPVVQLRQDEDL